MTHFDRLIARKAERDQATVQLGSIARLEDAVLDACQAAADADRDAATQPGDRLATIECMVAYAALNAAELQLARARAGHPLVRIPAYTRAHAAAALA